MDNKLFEWISELMGCTNHKRLLRTLFEMEFVPIMEMDDNRVYDGVKVRYEFGEVHNIPRSEIDDPLDQNVCSVLEMMVGLAMRIESSIMDDVDFGDRTSMWFWMMIKSLGLYIETDDRIDDHFVRDVISRFIDREYEHTGVGGLFTVNNTEKDMTQLEIWDQMCLFFDSIL